MLFAICSVYFPSDHMNMSTVHMCQWKSHCFLAIAKTTNIKEAQRKLKATYLWNISHELIWSLQEPMALLSPSILVILRLSPVTKYLDFSVTRLSDTWRQKPLSIY